MTTILTKVKCVGQHLLTHHVHLHSNGRSDNKDFHFIIYSIGKHWLIPSPEDQERKGNGERCVSVSV